MPQQAAQSAHDVLMRDHIAPALHERGFVGSNVFRKETPNGWHLLTFHGSHNATTGKVLLTFDVGAITHAAWAERKTWAAEHTPAVKVPERPSATWADPERIGILRMGLDQWYDYAPTADPAAMCARVMRDIDRYAMPYMLKRVPLAAK